jgi:hypothetical protein
LKPGRLGQWYMETSVEAARRGLTLESPTCTTPAADLQRPGFIKQRRAAVHELASTRKAVAFDDTHVPDGCWTEKRDKEEKVQTSKARDREFSALEDGGLLDEEVRPDI